MAGHPQVRRKLDDVAHKLNILYDKLRSQVLSPATLQGLHTILQHIWQYDYPSCMQVRLIVTPCNVCINLYCSGHLWSDCWRLILGDV